QRGSGGGHGIVVLTAASGGGRAWGVPQRAKISTMIMRPSLFIQPYVFHAPTVVDAVYHCRQTLDPGMPARRSTRVEDHRPRAFFLQRRIDAPDQLLTPLLVVSRDCRWNRSSRRRLQYPVKLRSESQAKLS